MQQTKILLKVLVIFLVLSNCVIFSQELEWQQTNGPCGGLVDNILICPNGTIFALAGLKMYKSTNNGNSWNYAGLTLANTSYSMVVKKNGNIFISEYRYVHKSTDNGLTWTRIQLSNSMNTVRLSINSSGDLFAAIGNSIFYSTDDGDGWTQINSSITANYIHGISTNSESNYYITSEVGVFQSTDKGYNWINVTNNLPAGSYSAVITKGGNVCVSGESSTGNGVIYTSTNNGNTWVQTFPSTVGITSLSKFVIDSTGNIWIASYGMLAKSTNNGISWVKIQNGLPYNNNIYRSFDVTPDGKIFAGGMNGVLLFENDAKNIVNLMNGLVGTNTTGITALKNGKIFARGEFDIFVTSDKGNNWTPTNAKSVFNYLFNTLGSLTSDENGYLYFGDTDGIGISKDAGATWSKKYITAANDIQYITFGENGMQFAISKNKIFRSTNSGTTWLLLKTFNENWNNYKMIVDRNGSVFHLRNDGVYKSIDDGINWSKITPSSLYEYSDFIISRNGNIISCSGDQVFISANSGLSWNSYSLTTYDESGTDLLLESIDGQLYANTSYGIYNSSDCGSTWTNLDNWDSRGFNINSSMAIDNEGYLYSSSFYKGVFRSISPVVKVFPSLISLSKPGDQKVYLNWSRNTSSNFASYKIYSGTSHYPSTVISTLTGNREDTSKTITGLMNDTTYYFVVSAVDNEGNESFSEEISVTPIAVPDIPLIQYPPNNSVNILPDCYFKWNNSQRADKYTIQVARDSAFSDISINDSILTDTTYKANSLIYNTFYYWRVKAGNISGESNWSVVCNFKTVIPPPDKPSLCLPNNNADNQQINLVVKWNKAKDADKYHLQISTNVDFSVLTMNDSIIADTSKQVIFENNKTYYWRLRGSNIGGNGLWSEIWKFKTIIALPGVPGLVSPSNNSKNNPTNIRLSWNAASDAETYRLQLSEDAVFSNLIVNDSAITVTSKDISGLKTGMKYYWRLNAKNSAGIGNNCPLWNFTTLLPSPENLHAVSTATRKVNLTWNDKSDNESGYILERKTEGEAGYRLIDTIKADITSYIDSTLSPATIYTYRMKAYTVFAVSDYSNETSVTTLTGVDELSVTPTEYMLTQNYPNPFNPVTNINYQIPKEGFVTLKVYDILGREVLTLINELKSVGKYAVQIDASGLVSGTYIYVMKVNDYKSVKKLTVLK